MTDFSPDVPAMNCGGEMGYAAGGAVDEGINLGDPLPYGTSDYSGPTPTDTDTIKGSTGAVSMPPVPPLDLPGLQSGIQTPPNGSQMPVARPAAVPSPQGPVFSPEAENFKAGSGVSPVSSLKSDEYAQLLKYLQPSRGQNIGRAAFSGLAGLADAITTGVGRAPSSNFQKNMMEQGSGERKDLIQALRDKYETGYKGKELDLRGKEIKQTGEHQKAEEVNTRRGQDLSAKTSAAEHEVQIANQGREAKQAQREADIKTVQDYGTFKSGGPTKQVYEQAMARLEGQGQNNIYSTPQAKAIKQQYQTGKITKSQANEMLNRLGK